MVQFILLIAIAFYFFSLERYVLCVLVLAVPILCIFRGLASGFFMILTQTYEFQFCSDAKLVVTPLRAASLNDCEQVYVVSRSSSVYDYVVILVLRDVRQKYVHVPVLCDAINKEEFRLLKNHIFYEISRVSSDLA